MGATTRSFWESGIDHELDFWQRYLASGGMDMPDDFRWRFDPNSPLQPHIADMVPLDIPVSDLAILDCAAGPATTLGKTLGGEHLRIVAVDALASHYDVMLSELQLSPPIPSIPCQAERLETLFEPDSFALVYMRFALDHCYEPIAALQQMVRVVLPGCVVMIEHYRDDREEKHRDLAWLRRARPA